MVKKIQLLLFFSIILILNSCGVKRPPVPLYSLPPSSDTPSPSPSPSMSSHS